jgi:hypothetical protein
MLYVSILPMTERGKAGYNKVIIVIVGLCGGKRRGGLIIAIRVSPLGNDDDDVSLLPLSLSRK